MPFKPQRGRKNFRGNSRGNFHGRGRGRGGERPKNDTKKSEYRHQEQLNEEDVGITEFINPLNGFVGVIKARFSDFQVSEINLHSTVAKLTDRSYPKDFLGKLQEFDYREVTQSPITEIPQEKWDQMRALLEKSDDTAEKNSEKMIVLDVAELDKVRRKIVHECIKKHFGQKLVANTKNIEHKLFMEIKKFDKYDPHRSRPWPQDKGEFVHFIIYKEMMDTMEACLLIGDKLNLKPSLISYAGVKDRRAKTTQWMCIKKIEPHKLISRTKYIRRLAIGNLEFKDKALKIGELIGNKFRIALRNVLAEDDLINKSLAFIKENGYINYYGLQRFGNDKEVPTYLIGLQLLRQQWKEAIDLILKVKTFEDPELDLTKAKQKYQETKNATEAIKLLNYGNRSLEAKLLDGLSKHKSTDYVNALESIPRNMRLMYIHSFQSLIWNQMASKRINEFGLKPVEGDLVLADENSGEIDPELLLDKEDREDENESDSEESKSTTSQERKQIDHDKEGEHKNIQQVKALTRDELENYTIYDIVLPLPGYDVQYPENLKSFYKEAIEKYGLSLDMPQQRVKTYNLSGAYRKVMGKPKDMSWKIMFFDDPTKDLILSDLDELKGWKEPGSVENGKFKALVMEFSLRPSSYATMVLREAMKCNTSSSMQAQLNYYAENKPNEKVNNKPKVFLEENETSKIEEKIEDGVTDSLLADKAKYQSFMNIVLGDTENQKIEGKGDVLKRPNEQNDDSEKSGIKKVKTCEESDKTKSDEANEKIEGEGDALKRPNEQNGDSEEPDIKKVKTCEESDTSKTDETKK